MKREHHGEVTIGQLTAQAVWTDGQVFTVRFPLAGLTPDQLQAVQQLQNTLTPLRFALNGTAAGEVRVMGHEHTSTFVTLHVAGVGSRNSDAMTG